MSNQNVIKIAQNLRCYYILFWNWARDAAGKALIASLANSYLSNLYFVQALTSAERNSELC